MAVLYSLSSAHKAALPPSINPPWHEAVTNIFNNMIGGVGRDYGWGFKAQGVVRDGCIELYHFGSNENKVKTVKLCYYFIITIYPSIMWLVVDQF